jgi:hypothetical protein
MLSQKELDFVEKLKALHKDLGIKPTRDQFMEYLGTRNPRFGSLTFNHLLRLAGLPLHPNQALAEIDPAPPKILFIDIEVCPMVVQSWGIRDQYIAHTEIISDWSILSFAAKWADSEDIIYYQVDPNDPRNDRDVCQKAFDLMNKAEVIVAHNSDFDTKKLRARWLFYGLEKERDRRSICTLKIARRNFKLTSAKLDYLAKYLDVINKLDHGKFPGMKLFSECAKGNPEAFIELEIYNCRDVLTLEAVYLKLRRYDKSIRFNIFNQDNICSCGSKEFREVGPITTNAGVFRTWQCVECGYNLRDTKNLLSAQLRKSLMK